MATQDWFFQWNKNLHNHKIGSQWKNLHNNKDWFSMEIQWENLHNNKDWFQWKKIFIITRLVLNGKKSS
jgi:hypothetical protein